MGWSRFVRRRYWDEERARELEAYVAIETDDNIARGMPPAEARRAALRKLGNRTLIREEIYRMNSLGFVESLCQDLRYGARLLVRNPTFALVAILTLAFGIGANTAIFEVANAVWLRPLPLPHAEQLVQVQLDPHKGGRSGNRTGRYSVLSIPEWEQLRTRQTVFSSVAAWGTASFDLARGGPVQRVEGMWVSGPFFDTLGVRAFRGRTLTVSDDRDGCGSPGMVVSHAFWQRQFGGEAAIGRMLSLNGRPLEIVGITPPGFTGIEVGRSFDVAVPLCAAPLLDREANPARRQTFWFLGAIGRLAPGVSVGQASAALTAMSPAMYLATVPSTYEADAAKEYLALTLLATPAATGVSTLRQDFQQPIWVLLGATAVVLLTACANLANLMLARATTRAREIAVRLAIGASRGRVVRQLVSESLLVAIVGSGVGLLVAHWATAGLIALIARTNPALWIDVTPDRRVLAFALGAALLACVLFGVAPALRGTAVNPGAAMKAGGRGVADAAGRFSLRSGLVVAQVALSLVLLIGALLFARTLRNLAMQDVGFEAGDVAVAALDLTPAKVPAEPVAMFHDRLLSRIRAIPGIEAAAEVSVLPIDGSGWNQRIVIDGRPAATLPMFNAVTPGFFATMGSAMVAGRDFRSADATAAPTAIVNESFVRQYFGAGHPLGRVFEVVVPLGRPRPRYTVIGVVKDSKYSSLRQPFLPIVYVDMEQMPADDPFPHLMVRSRMPHRALANAVSRAVAEVDPRISMRYRTMQSVIDGALSRERMMTILSTVFGGLATLIAMIGLYGVMSYAVARRRIEIGIRMALGAEAARVRRMVIAEAGALVVAGLLVGTALAVAAARSAASLLYGVQPSDPMTLAIAALSLGGVALAASWLPAYRASRIDPTVALRED